MSETHPDYGRDEDGRYTGNPQCHPEHELRGETQESIGAIWSTSKPPDRTGREYFGSLIIKDAIRLAVALGVDRDEVWDEIGRAAHGMPEPDRRFNWTGDGAVPMALADLSIHAFALADHLCRMGTRVELTHEVNVRMAALRYPPRKVPVDKKSEWIADADARKGADDAQ